MGIPGFFFDVGDAFAGLLRRPFRSFLSGLGIGIGVVALVAMLAISEGARIEAMDKIASLGIDTIRVENLSERAATLDQGALNLSQGLTDEDVRQLEHWLTDQGRVVAYTRRSDVPVSRATRVQTATLIGTSSDWFAVEGLELAWGRFLHRQDQQLARPACIVGAALAAQLQLTPAATLQVGPHPCHVVGVLKPKGMLLTEGTGLSSINFDHSVIMPLEAFPYARQASGRPIMDGLVVSLPSDQRHRIYSVADQLARWLDIRHHGVSDFLVVTPAKLLDEARRTHRLFGLITGAIAGLSLLVGGIGVMNVMLANVSEQTREIGLRMAVGATPARIISLYVWHSVLIAVVGSIWGLATGIGIAYAIQTYAHIQVAFSPSSLVVGPLAAMLSGILFGIQPAMRAAYLDPAIALRES